MNQELFDLLIPHLSKSYLSILYFILIFIADSLNIFFGFQMLIIFIFFILYNFFIHEILVLLFLFIYFNLHFYCFIMAIAEMLCHLLVIIHLNPKQIFNAIRHYNFSFLNYIFLILFYILNFKIYFLNSHQLNLLFVVLIL